MDVDNLLNFERRTGIKDSDIDGFLSKAEEVERAIKSLRDGTVKPEDVKVDGIDFAEDIERKQREKQEKLELQRKQEEELLVKRAAEEKEKWWAGADLFRIHGDVESLEDEQTDISSKMLRYSADYSRWEQWSPNDPASLEEEADKENKLEKIKNEEFERNNPEFCNQFKSDMTERQKTQEKKASNANIFRLKGNTAFKNGKFKDALHLYKEALKSSPYDGKILLNMVQVFIKQKDYANALEFCARTLYLNENNAKCWSRQAAIYKELNDMENAVLSCEKALHYEPTNKDIIIQHDEIKAIADDWKEDMRVKSLLELRKETVESNANNTSLPSTIGKFDKICEEIDSFTSWLTANAVELILSEDSIWSMSKVQALSDAVLQSKDGRVYGRTSGALHSICSCVVKSQSALKTIIQSNQANVYSMLIELLFNFCDAEKSSSLILYECKLLGWLDACYAELSGISAGESLNADKISLMCNINGIVGRIYADCLKSRQFLISVGVIRNMIALLMFCSSYLSKAFPKMKSSVNELTIKAEIQMITGIKHMLEHFKSVLFSPEGKAEIEGAGVKAGEFLLVRSIASVLLPVESLFSLCNDYVLANKKEAIAYMKVLLNILDLGVECLQGASQLSSLWGDFVVSLTGAKGTDTCVSVLLKVLKHLNYQESNTLAILMNITIESSKLPTAVSNRDAVCENKDVVEYALSCLSITDIVYDKLFELENVEISLGKVIDGSLMARKVGLLSRLISSGPVAKRILGIEQKGENVSKFQLFSHMLTRSCSRYRGKTDGSVQTTPQWCVTELEHLVRAFASLNPLLIDPNGDQEAKRKYRSIILEEKVLESLIEHVFPMPRTELGEVTVNSVIQCPKEAVNSLMIGNAARILIGFSDILDCATVIFGSKKLLTIERLICSMATCTDIRVRKNIAIIVAKACKFSTTVRERVTELRGLQMMIELQDKL